MMYTILLLFSLLIVSIHAKDYHTLFMAVQQDNADKVHRAIAAGADVNDQSEGPNVLLFAIALDKVDAARALLDNGVDYTVQSSTGWNAMDQAGEHGKYRMVQLLGNYQDANGNYVIREALLKEPNPEDGLYPIHRACKGNSGDHAKTVTEFIDLGVPWDIQTRDGETCRDLTTSQITKYALAHAAAEAAEGRGEEL